MCALVWPFLVGLEIAGAEHIILGLNTFGFGSDVQHGGVDVGVPQELLDGQQVGTAGQHVGGQGVSEQVGVHPFLDQGAGHHGLDPPPESILGVWVAVAERGKQAAVRLPWVVAQVIEHGLGALTGDTHDPALGALAVGHLDGVAGAVDVLGDQVTQLFVSGP